MIVLLLLVDQVLFQTTKTAIQAVLQLKPMPK
ncbi:hypothetical protein AsAng_0047100 [Aureispira anguillae]|uniref:Uncharacterized protein n=1 Tax=Aureispira anguillae TaxID=2864201 RepID=A0A916DVP4_9BACT|nr:hypothetical protein AsAng_0047100 [Aureispira anguillae]